MRRLLIIKILMEMSIYIYVLLTGRYAGDSIGANVTISDEKLLLVLFITILPYWILYKFIRSIKLNKKYLINVNGNVIKIVLISGFLSIFFTLEYGSGIVSKGLYSAPFAIIPFIVITNRFDLQIIGLLLIYSNNIRIYNRLLWFEILSLSLLRSSFQSIGFFIMYVVSKIKTYILLIIILLVFVAEYKFGVITNSINTLYSYRDSLRGVDYEGNLGGFDLIVGKCVARMSNFSNIAIIFENYDAFILGANKIGFYDYLIDAMQYIWGSFYNVTLPSIQSIYTEILDPSSNGKYGMSPSLSGVLLMSYLNGVDLMAFNILIYFISVYGICKLAMKFAGVNAREYTYLLLITDLSGLSSYNYKILFTLLIFTITVIFFSNIFSKINLPKIS